MGLLAYINHTKIFWENLEDSQTALTQIQWYALIIRLNSDSKNYIGDILWQKNVIVYHWGLYLVKKFIGVLLGVISGEKNVMVSHC